MDESKRNRLTIGENMKISEAKYTRRFNLGDYEHEEYSLTCVVEDDDKGTEALLELKKEVLVAHSNEPPEVETEEKEEKKNAKSSSSKNSNKNGKAAGKGAKGSDDEGSEDNEESDAETSDDDNDPPESDEAEDAGDEAEDEEQETKPVKGKNSKGKSGAKDEGKKTFKKKPQTYNRSIEQHKEIFGGVVRSINPKWKDNDVTKKKVKKASESLEGEDFLDENGEVIEDFKAKVKKLIK